MNARIAVRHDLRLGALLGCLVSGDAAASNALYYGGPVISDTEIVMVDWGPDVPTILKDYMSQFYGDVIQSNYWTVMLQYSTAGVTPQDGMPGSNQTLGMGSFLGQYTITPSVCPGTIPCTVTSDQVATELANQIAAQNLPPPSFDAQGYPNTSYVVHFAGFTRIHQGAYYVCDDFCATSINFDYGATKLAAVLLPDHSTSTCYNHCARGNTLQTATAWASNELAGLTTCPLLASAVDYAARPVAWYEPQGVSLFFGRINDKCDPYEFGGISTRASISVNGNTYTVQKLWSNAAQSCTGIGPKFVVVPSADTGGGINPSLPQAVSVGGMPAFTVTADPGFIVAGVGGTCGGTLVGSTYTTAAVIADCTVVASFLGNGIFASSFEGGNPP